MGSSSSPGSLRDLAASRDRQRLYDPIALDQADDVDEVRDDAGVIRDRDQDANPTAVNVVLRWSRELERIAPAKKS